MVHDKSPGKHSPARLTRSTYRYQPTAARQPSINHNTTSPPNQASCSTIYTLSIPEQHLGTTPINLRPSVPGALVHGASNLVQSDYHGGGLKGVGVRPVSELDKVEDMDIDHPSEDENDAMVNLINKTAHEDENATGSSVSVTPRAVNGRVSEVKTPRKFKRAIKQATQVNQMDKVQPSSTEKKNSQPDQTTKAPAKKKPIYIILHAAMIRVGDVVSKASSPVRIQAEKIIIETEVKSGSTTETLKLRVPFKEVIEVQANLSKPPYLLVISVNEKYIRPLLHGAKKNGPYYKEKGLSKVVTMIQLTYDQIPDDVKQDLDRLCEQISPDIKWNVISPSQARDMLKGKDYLKDSGETEETIHVEPEKERTILKGQGKKAKIKTTTKEAATEIVQQPSSKSKPESQKAPVSPRGQATMQESGNQFTSTSIESGVVKSRRKRAYDGTTRAHDGTIRTCSKTDSKKVVEREKVKDEKNSIEISKQSPLVSGSNNLNEVVSVKESDTAGTGSGNNCVHSQECSFEENRLVLRRINELESSVTEKTGLLNQRRISLELKELQLDEERKTVRELRGELRDEQTTRRSLETRFEAVNDELVSTKGREFAEKSRVDEMERALSQLNISLSDVRRDNHRLVQEIREVRTRMTQTEVALTAERNNVKTLREDLARERTSLSSLREELGAKTNELREEQNLRSEAVETANRLEQRMTSAAHDFETRLQQLGEERASVGRQYEECNRELESTRGELRDTTRALHRAQETIEEYSRMQPRDWTISRDEIEISDRVLGQGAWGWVKEGTFRGTQVAVKQMHELIVSPHNRRLFEREMQMAARCRHPSLLQFIGATNDSGLAWLVTELLNTNLRAVLGERSLCHDEVMTLSLDVARALNYLHLNRPFPIIHRDISSTNVLLWKREEAWHAKLSDYGAANFMRQSMTTSPGALIYAAPEAVTSQQSPKVDVFSFGLLLCEMCIRELPVPGHTHDQIRLITNAHLRDLVQRCTNRTAENRPTMQEVLSALEHSCSSATMALGRVSVNSRQVTR